MGFISKFVYILLFCNTDFHISAQCFYYTADLHVTKCIIHSRLWNSLRGTSNRCFPIPNLFNIEPVLKIIGFKLHLLILIVTTCRHAGPQWPRGLRRWYAAARMPRSWVRIPPGAWMFVCCECCVLSGRGLCDELITRPEKTYRMWCVGCVWSGNLKNWEVMTRVGPQRHREKKNCRHGKKQNI